MANQHTNPPGSSTSNGRNNDSFGQSTSDSSKAPFGSGPSQSSSGSRLSQGSPSTNIPSASPSANAANSRAPGASSTSSSASTAGSYSRSHSSSSAIDDEQSTDRSSSSGMGALSGYADQARKAFHDLTSSVSSMDFNGMKQKAGTSARGAYDKVSTLVKENPRAAAGIGIAVGALLLRRMSSSSSRTARR